MYEYFVTSGLAACAVFTEGVAYALTGDSAPSVNGSTYVFRTYTSCSVLLRHFFFYLETIGTAATPGLLCQPRVIMKMVVESMMECRLAGETEVIGENLPRRHFCPSQNPTCPIGFEPGPPRWEAGG
jgi:hypothetical protein